MTARIVKYPGFASGSQNAKMRKLSNDLGYKPSEVYSWNLPAGYTCPQASECLSKADRQTGRIKDGPACRFRCYAASLESVYGNVRQKAWKNFDLLRTAGIRNATAMADAIDQYWPKKAKVIRLHVSGDLFSAAYMRSWIILAGRHPDVVIYGYTKCIRTYLNLRGQMPENFRLTMSLGGRQDSLIHENGLRYAKVILTESDAEGLPINLTDRPAYDAKESFCLLIHGTQKAGSPESKASYANKKKGIG